jgi:tRNA(His) guanylyltransferase
MKDELGDRIKSYYENRIRTYLPRRTYTIIRVDGKSFKNYTRGLARPFDEGFMEDMDATACYLCKNIQGAKFAFVQSDEISILLTDFDKIGTDAWFDGNIQKMVSVAASLATTEFNKLRILRMLRNAENNIDLGHDSDLTILKIKLVKKEEADSLVKIKFAEFDARVFTIPCDYEVENYFIWRQKDATKNSISIVAQNLYSHKELEGKNGDQKQEMIFQKGINWNDYAPKFKRGRFIFKKIVEMETPFITADKKQTTYQRNIWTSGECPIFTQEREFLLKYIPKNN